MNNYRKIKRLIKQSNLMDIVKNHLIERLDLEDICEKIHLDEVELDREKTKIFFDDMYIMDLYQRLTGHSIYEQGKIRSDVETIVKCYFQTSMIGFPYTVMTMDYVILYTPE